MAWARAHGAEQKGRPMALLGSARRRTWKEWMKNVFKIILLTCHGHIDTAQGTVNQWVRGLCATDGRVGLVEGVEWDTLTRSDTLGRPDARASCKKWIARALCPVVCETIS